MAQPGQIRITLENSDEVKCEECGNNTFIEVHFVRRISKLLIGASDDMITNIPAFACSKCGHVNKQFQLMDSKEGKPNDQAGIITQP